MPIAPPKPCTACGVLVRDGTARCEAHKVRLGQFGDQRRGSRQSRGYGAAWDRLRKLILRRDDGLCQPCLSHGRVTTATAVDHKVPKAQGGTDDESNLQSICKRCHKDKTARESQTGRGGGKV